jgi:2'-5' RNA ligase
MAATGLRLFYALWPDDEVRAALRNLQALTSGRLTRYENLHITLAFLGNQPEENLPALKNILAGLPSDAMVLTIDRLGYFRKNRIAWAGSHAVPDALHALQTALAQSLEQQGLAFDKQNRFKPHITLARDAAAPVDQPFEPIAWKIAQVTLMQSLQSEGRLSYRVLATHRLR